MREKLISIAENALKEKIIEKLKNIKHSMIDESLKDLGIIKDIDVRSDEVNITSALPFPEIPIKEEIIWSIKKFLINITDKIKIRETFINELERQKFFNMERKSWKEMGL